MFDWDQRNEGHIREAHGVSREEAEDVLLSPDRFLKRADPSHGERRFVVIGTTAPGRVLAVIYTHRAGLIRVVASRPASVVEERTWRRQRRRRT